MTDDREALIQVIGDTVAGVPQMSWQWVATAIVNSEWYRERLAEAWDEGAFARDPRRYIGVDPKKMNPYRKADS